jgi:hypothetical protein
LKTANTALSTDLAAKSAEVDTLRQELETIKNQPPTPIAVTEPHQPDDVEKEALKQDIEKLKGQVAEALAKAAEIAEEATPREMEPAEPVSTPSPDLALLSELEMVKQQLQNAGPFLPFTFCLNLLY